MGHAIKAGDPRLARIDVLVPGFLAREDFPPVELPLHRSLCKVTALREETAYSCLSPKRSPNSRKRPKTKGGPSQRRVRRLSTWPTCINQLRIPSWSWMARRCPRAPPLGSSREATLLIWPRLWSVPSCCLKIWML